MSAGGAFGGNRGARPVPLEKGVFPWIISTSVTCYDKLIVTPLRVRSSSSLSELVQMNTSSPKKAAPCQLILTFPFKQSYPSQIRASGFRCKKQNNVFLILCLIPDRPEDFGQSIRKEKQEYIACLKASKFQSEKCRHLSKKYLECRMERNLMAKQDMSTLGFGKESQISFPEATGE
ncbi:hypothetical protein HPP92_023801 [Vanilla planifolia]|uniref:Cytochrome c oxidase assembly protein COX19 n=1 Tax=Vanilla planifolia TaxID=51239 RepID=A0A835PNK2_VANPL|nr:hypothetical protein HPP92_023801 [Vanilla planifolia]